MSWQDRLKANLVLRSPKSDTMFFPLWRGDDIGFKKRIGEFSFPLVDGTLTQDLGMDGLDIPLTFYFQGADHDLEAWKFALCAAERGPWKITHPVYGDMSLQLIGGTLKVQPVESGGATEVESKWIKPTALTSEASPAELAAAIAEQAAAVDVTLADQLAMCAQTTIDNLAAIGNAVASAINKVKRMLTAVDAAVNMKQAQITAALAVFPGDLYAIAGMTQSLLETPGLVKGSLIAQVARYNQMVAAMLGIVPDPSAKPDANTANTVKTVELLTGATVCAIASAITTTMPASRAEALATIEKVLQLWADITATLDAFQSAFADNPLVSQYFTHATSYTDLSRLIGLVIKYLLSVIFDLKTEIRFTIATQRAPLEIALSYYGQEKWSDVFFDAFIAANNLTGDRILLLPAGTEVVVYA